MMFAVLKPIFIPNTRDAKHEVRFRQVDTVEADTDLQALEMARRDHIAPIVEPIWD